MTALIDAARKGDTTVIKAFIAAGANVNFIEGGATPLHYAALRCDRDLGRILVHRGTDINFKDEIDYNSMDYANVDRCRNFKSNYTYDYADLTWKNHTDSANEEEANKFQTEIAKAFLEASDHVKVSNKESKIPTDPVAKEDPTEAVKISVKASVN